jgi:hypothetical protein
MGIPQRNRALARSSALLVEDWLAITLPVIKLLVNSVAYVYFGTASDEHCNDFDTGEAVLKCLGVSNPCIGRAFAGWNVFDTMYRNRYVSFACCPTTSTGRAGKSRRIHFLAKL